MNNENWNEWNEMKVIFCWLFDLMPFLIVCSHIFLGVKLNYSTLPKLPSFRVLYYVCRREREAEGENEFHEKIWLNISAERKQFFILASKKFCHIFHFLSFLFLHLRIFISLFNFWYEGVCSLVWVVSANKTERNLPIFVKKNLRSLISNINLKMNPRADFINYEHYECLLFILMMRNKKFEKSNVVPKSMRLLRLILSNHIHPLLTNWFSHTLTTFFCYFRLNSQAPTTTIRSLQIISFSFCI